jgi:hypothetical protein
VLESLIEAWDNPHYAVEPGTLREIAMRAVKCSGHILECGSGISTIVLGLVGHSVWSLEHNHEWYQRVKLVVRRLRLPVQVFHTPLKSYGGFEWYDVARLQFPMFQLVICDGPPGATTNGGRYGLLPLLSRNLEPNAAIMLDDANRQQELDILSRWEREFGIRFSLHQSHLKKYAIAHFGQNPRRDEV